MSLRSHGIRAARTLAWDLRSTPELKRGFALTGWRQHSAASSSCRPIPSACSLYERPSLRKFSTKQGTDTAPESNSTDGSDAHPAPDTASAPDEAAGENSEASSSSPEDAKIAELEQQVKDLKDNLLRSLAEQENTRRIAKRDVEQARSFAISSFAKSLLDTSDNLARALDAVPEDLRHDHDSHPVLANLYEGITMTNEGLTKAFAKNGLVKFGAVGEKFDPNKHEALFEYPDPNGEAGSIGQVMKIGFMLNDRVIRPAEVGVIKAS